MKTVSKPITVSDFSGVEIPPMHWSAVTKISAAKFDAAGNKYTVFDLDLLPEEMQEFRTELDRVIGQLTAKYRARVKRQVTPR